MTGVPVRGKDTETQKKLHEDGRQSWGEAKEHLEPPATEREGLSS